jgi:hypothetical protein
MGGLSSRYFMKNLGGSDVVSTFVTLGTMHHGLDSPCLAPEFLNVCVWQELCSSGEFMEQLNADPAVPEGAWWVSIYGTEDPIIPNESSHLEAPRTSPSRGPSTWARTACSSGRMSTPRCSECSDSPVGSAGGVGP